MIEKGKKDMGSYKILIDLTHITLSKNAVFYEHRKSNRENV